MVIRIQQNNLKIIGNHLICGRSWMGASLESATLARKRRSASTTIAGPRTARLVVSISSPITAEIPEPPAAAAPTCQAIACCARSSPIRCGVTAMRAGKDAGERAAENDKREDYHDGPWLQPDQAGGRDGEEQAAADDRLCRHRLGGQGKADPDGGQRAPVAEGGQPGSRCRQAKVAADVAGLPLARAHLKPGVHEEHDQSQREDRDDRRRLQPAVGRAVSPDSSVYQARRDQAVDRAGLFGRSVRRRSGNAPAIGDPAARDTMSRAARTR